MKNLNILIFIASLCFNLGYSQVSTKIIDVMVNNQATISNCNTIDFGTVSNNNLNPLGEIK